MIWEILFNNFDLNILENKKEECYASLQKKVFHKPELSQITVACFTLKKPSFYDNNPHDGRNYCHIIYHNMTQKSIAS